MPFEMPIEPDPEKDLEREELIESSGMQNLVATTGPFALLILPISKGMVWLKEHTWGRGKAEPGD